MVALSSFSELVLDLFSNLNKSTVNAFSFILAFALVLLHISMMFLCVSEVLSDLSFPCASLSCLIFVVLVLVWVVSCTVPAYGSEKILYFCQFRVCLSYLNIYISF